MFSSNRGIIYTSEVAQDQADSFLAQLEEWATQEYEAEFFTQRFEEALNHVKEDVEYGEPFGFSEDYQFAILDHQIVGYLFLNPNSEEYYREESPDCWPHGMIWDLYVLPPYRHQGIAKALIQQGLEVQHDELESFYQLYAREEEPLRIGAEGLNETSDRFFQSLGFMLIPFENNAYGWVMDLTLLKAKCLQ